MSQKPEFPYLAIGRIRKTHGRRGELAVEILTDFPDRFQPGKEICLGEEGRLQPVILEACWFHKGLAILKFRECDSLSAAEHLVGLWLWIPRSERRELPQGAVYLADLIGCEVIEEARRLGTVEAIEETGAAPLLRVRNPEGDFLIPFAQEICLTVDVESKQIQVRLPEGLLELNRKSPRSPRGKRPGKTVRQG